MLEFYWAYANFNDLMDLTEDLMSTIVKDVTGSDEVEYQGTKISFGRPWRRLTMEDAVREYSGYKGALNNPTEIAAYLKSKGVELTGREGPGALFNKIFEEEVDRKLIQPTFITAYPVEVSPLARRSEEKSKAGIDVTDRFELFINGIEIANGFNELNDPDDQKERFLDQLKEKDAGNVEACDFDADYIRALEYGMPPVTGFGVSERLFSFLADKTIRECVLFPLLKPEEHA
jgi:lysyl-tRNA synthetase class 2